MQEKITKKISVISIDLDGTLLNSNGIITKQSLAAIQKADEAGIMVVVATGRDFDAIFPEQLSAAGVKYAITTNGSAIYEIDSKKCIYENGVSAAEIIPIITEYEHNELFRDVYLELFIDGSAYTSIRSMKKLDEMAVSKYLKSIMQMQCNVVDDLEEYIMNSNRVVQKGAFVFEVAKDGMNKNWEKIRTLLEQKYLINVVDGGCSNLEFNKLGVSKASGLMWLTNYLDVPIDETLAFGDGENDWQILKLAGISVVMGNASDETKEIADIITKTNDEDGVAWVINQSIL